MKKYITIGETAEILGVSVSTMRRWEREGKFCSDKRTLGMHRRYEKEKILRKGDKEGRISVGYARVSSYDQK